MKIKSQLTVGMIIFCVIFLLIGASAIHISWHIQKLGKQQEIANNVVRGAYELSYLSNDYLFHLEKRQNIQWDSRFISLGNEISRLDVDTPEQQVLVNRIITNKERLKEIYTESVTSIESAKNTPGGSVDPEMIQVAWSRFIVQNQGIIFDASQLSQMLNEEQDQLQFTNSLIIFSLLGAFCVVLLSNYLLISRHILRSLSTLQEGTEVIGSGNLDFTVEEISKDEIGALSHAFNRMTMNLRTITASKKDLEKEIEDRKRAEGEIQLLNATLEQRVRDRTQELEQATEVIRASLDEKVILLREVHHRVKNNLQIIISLTNLQMRQIDDKQLKQVMVETQNRVRAMSFVHEKLFLSEDLSHIDLSDYTRYLVTHLFTSNSVNFQQVSLNLDIKKIMLDINTAIPVGLIVNELVSNSLRYAFPDGMRGEISIAIQREDHTLTLVFKDNGIGIPADLDWRDTKSLGLRLVITLVEQLDGTIELDRTAGTTFTIVVKEKV